MPNELSDTPRITRRAALGLGALLVTQAGCSRLRDAASELTGKPKPTFVPLPADTDAVRAAVHMLNRAAFGAAPGEVARVVGMGVPAYLEEQIADRMDEAAAVRWRVGGLDVQETVQDDPYELRSMADDQLLREIQQAALLRAVYSTHRLREVMADFWTNHFNIYALKGDGRVLIPVDTERVVRPHTLGTFREMLVASAHSPAMLTYLDNPQNKRGVPNENYARELLELHTLGVHSGYSQADIQEVARCFTGWRIKRGYGRGQFTFDPKKDFVQGFDAFEYDSTLHDDGAKYVPFLHLTLTPRGGAKDADTVLDALAIHPATARFLAEKLCRRFLGDAPPAMVETVAAAYLKSDTDIKATLRPLLLDGVTNPALCQPIFRRPLDLAIAALRALGADTDGGTDVQKHLDAMGQPLYQWPMPDGFPEKASAWTSSLLPRWNFALALTAGEIGGTTTDLPATFAAHRAKTAPEKVAALATTLYNLPADAPECRPLCAKVMAHRTRAEQAGVPEKTADAEAAGLLMAAPAYQWK